MYYFGIRTAFWNETVNIDSSGLHCSSVVNGQVNGDYYFEAPDMRATRAYMVPVGDFDWGLREWRHFCGELIKMIVWWMCSHYPSQRYVTDSVSCHQTRGHVTPVTLPVSGECLQAVSSAPPLPWSRSPSPHSGASHRPGLWLVTGSSPGLWLAGRVSLSPATLSVRAPGHGTRRTDQWSEPESRDQRVASGGTIPDTTKLLVVHNMWHRLVTTEGIS